MQRIFLSFSNTIDSSLMCQFELMCYIHFINSIIRFFEPFFGHVYFRSQYFDHKLMNDRVCRESGLQPYFYFKNDMALLCRIARWVAYRMKLFSTTIWDWLLRQEFEGLYRCTLHAHACIRMQCAIDPRPLVEYIGPSDCETHALVGSTCKIFK